MANLTEYEVAWERAMRVSGMCRDSKERETEIQGERQNKQTDGCTVNSG